MRLGRRGAPSAALHCEAVNGASTSGVLQRAGIASVSELSELPALERGLRWFGAQKRWIDSKHLELCRIAAPTFQEERRAAWMAAEFKALGCDVSIDRSGNVIAEVPSPPASPLVLITAHLDTVLAPRQPEDVRVNGNGRIEGPGVADNGAGLAALLALAAAIRSDDEAAAAVRSRIHFIANVGEEGEGNLSGMRYLCSQFGGARPPAAVVVLDGPRTDHITARAVASRRFEVTVTGPGGHSWSDFGVGNPVQALSRAITLFAESRANGARGGPPPPGFKTAFNFGTIDGGATVNSIPTLARAKVDLRSEHAPLIDELAEALTGSVERALEIENGRSTGARLAAKIREIGSRPSGRLAEDSLLLQSLQAVDSHLGIRARLDCASTDANIPLALGWEAVTIGAGGHGGGAHTPSEWYDPEGRDIGLKRILLTVSLLGRLFEAGRMVIPG